MLTANVPKIRYHGWEIDIKPCGVEFCFECHTPTCPDALDDAESYITKAAALAAAQAFVDRESAVLALIKLANDWLINGLISEDEYWALTDFEEVPQ
ncbi:MAG: hypothetical protein AAFQ89_14445 [Cyanobacteria bacterium J06626_18]